MNIYRGVPDNLIYDRRPPYNTVEYKIYMNLVRDSPAKSIINIIKCSALSCNTNCPVNHNLHDGCPVCGSAVKCDSGPALLVRCICGTYIMTTCARDTAFGLSIPRKTYDDLKSSGMIQTDDEDTI